MWVVVDDIRLGNKSPKYSGYSIKNTYRTIKRGSETRGEFKNDSQVFNLDDWVSEIPEAQEDKEDVSGWANWGN